MERRSRRSFLQGAAMIATACATHSLPGIAQASKSPFRVAVINDEISPDFDHACYVASHDFGMSWIELRGRLIPSPFEARSGLVRLTRNCALSSLRKELRK